MKRRIINAIRTQLRSDHKPASLDSFAVPGLVALAVLSVSATPAAAQDWGLTGAPTNFWRAIAISADGGNLAAMASDVSVIWSSTDSGSNWHATGSPAGLWKDLASSADGTKLLAVGSDYMYLTNGLDIWTIATASRVCTSTNSGASWTQCSGMPTNVTWTATASSADGTKLVAGATSGAIYTSTNAGGTWVLRAAPNKQWNAVASSADGTRLAAVAVKGGIFTSTNSGATWIPTSAQSDLWWWDVASSADGRALVAVSKYNASATADGSVYVSSDAGTNWLLTSAPSHRWEAVAASADATTIAAVAFGVICVSRDAGATWATTNPPSGNSIWNCVAASADGSRLFAGISFGGIYTAQTQATPRLRLSGNGARLVISWIIPSVEFALQENSDLNSANWTEVSASPTVIDYQKQVILTPAPGRRFYRLKTP